MDQFTQRMLERARARQEKIDQKLLISGQTPKRKPLTENIVLNSETPHKSPLKTKRDSVTPKNSILKSESSDKTVVSKEIRPTVSTGSNDYIVTKKEFKTANGNSLTRRNSDVSLEINITHRDDIKIEVQVEERDAPLDVCYENQDSISDVVVTEISEKVPIKKNMEVSQKEADLKSDRGGLRHNIKSRLDRLGVLYSDKADLSSPIHRTELEFNSETPPDFTHQDTPRPKPDGKKKFGRLAALADQINNWEDDLTHHEFKNDAGKHTKPVTRKDKADSSTLDVSLHSLSDINKALQFNTKPKQTSKPVNCNTYSRLPTNVGGQRLDSKIVAQLEPNAATPSATAAPDMAAMVATNPPAIAKKPSLKKYKAPTPPRKINNEENCDDKDKENNVQQREQNDNDATESCVQTNPEPTEGKAPEKGSPLVKRIAPKLNGNIDRSSVLSKAAIFEAGSPKAKDPAEMSLRERKALFEKNKGAAIIPKAPFGLAPSVKTLYGDNNRAEPRVTKPVLPTAPTISNSRENIQDDNISQSSIGGIKGKLAALFSKEQTISETTITNKFKQERNREMEMLQNRFQYKPQQKPEEHHSDDDCDNSEDAPLMGSTLSLSQVNKKPEIVANITKVIDKTKSESALHSSAKPEIVSAQPAKRRSSQDSPVVLSVLDDVKRIKVNDKKDQPNAAVLQQPQSIYPHLSDIETDNSNTQEEYSDCGGSSEEMSVNLNKSDDWGDTSLSREVMSVVKKNNTSYKKAVRESSESSNVDMDSELDEMLDEALNEEDEGPTPPKLNKNNANTSSSKSFTYYDSPKKQFKSPLKQQAQTPRDTGGELVHSVSFYRRTQNASQPSTPMRVVRHTTPEKEMPSTPAPPPAITVRQRIKELHQDINKQQTIISQASQALNLCAATIEFSGSTEQAEGERLLLLATHRRQACMHEVQRLQVEGAGPAGTAGMASLHIQGLSVPLRRDYMMQINADGAVGHHAVCLLKCRDRVLATSMQQTSPKSNILHFPDEIQMDGLASDFKVTIEVYLLQASKEFLPHDVKYHISKKTSSKLLTPKSKVSELKAPRLQSPGGPQTVRSPQFQLHGYCIFALQQANRNTFTLNKVPHGSPLDGSINVHISARLRVSPPATHAAFLTAFDDVSGLGAWHRRWLVLQAPRLSYWRYPDDVHTKMPMGDIDLTTVVSERIEKAPRDLCARPNTLLLESAIPAGMIVPDSQSLVYSRKPDGSIVRRHLLAADTPKDRDVWLECLNKALEYVRCCSTDN